jgi:hypothetical protein
LEITNYLGNIEVNISDINGKIINSSNFYCTTQNNFAINTTEVYSGVNTFGVGVGLTYRF